MGGKSRKSGGVSKSLIALIKHGDKANCGKTKPKNNEPQKSIFD